MTDLFGQEVALASPSRQQENKAAAMTKDISGLRGFGSPESVALTLSLANRLRERLGSDGSIEYSQTWRMKVTPAGRRYWAHTASGRRTSGSVPNRVGLLRGSGNAINPFVAAEFIGTVMQMSLNRDSDD